MEEKRNVLKKAFYLTIPVLLGYIFIGIAFGILLQNKGYSFLWAIAMCVIMYSGSAQFIAIDFLVPNANLLNAAVISLFLSIRHIAYSLAMLKRFRIMGKKKLYMIYALTDETFSILCMDKLFENTDKKQCMFFVTLFNHLYWIAGCVIGCVLGGFFTFNTKGIDFIMTALFTVIFVDQWKSAKTHLPAVIGVVISVLCLILFGSSNFLLPAMIFIIICLSFCRNYIENKQQNRKEEEPL